MRPCRFVVMSFLLLFPFALGFAQKSIDIEEIRRLVLYFEIGAGSEFTTQQQSLLYESLLSNLSNASEKVALLESRDERVPLDDQEKTSAAENIGADSWLHLVVSGNFESIGIQARCLDLLNGIIAFELDLEKEIIRGTRELGLLMWREVEDAVGDYFDRALNMENRIGDLTFQALPGTRIQGIGRGRLKTTEQGIATAQVALPSTIPFRATKPGYFPVEGQVYVDQTEKVISLEQELAARIALNVYLHNMSYPGFDLMYFFIPDTLFGRVGFLTYLVGFVLDDGDEESGSVFTGHTLNNFSLSLGFFFSDPDRPFRPYFALGAAWRLVTANGYWGLEPVAPFAAQPVLGWEYARSQKIKIFAEYAPYFYWVPERYLFDLSLPPDRDLAFLFIPRRDDLVDWAWVWEILVFNVGVRIRL